MGDLENTIATLCRAGHYDDGFKALLPDPKHSMIEDSTVEAARILIESTCAVDRVADAERIVQRCPPHLLEHLKLSTVVDAMLRRRRFEMASRAISSFGLLERNDLSLLHRFFSALVTKGQYRMAVEWARKLAEREAETQMQYPEYLRWTPSALVSAMINAEHYDQALKFIRELQLTNEFPVEDIIGRLLVDAKFAPALSHIKSFGLETRFPALKLMNGMLSAKQWESAISFANEVPALWDHFPKVQLVESMILSKDWTAAFTYIVRFRLDQPGGESKILIDLVRALVAESEFFKAMEYVLRYKLETVFPPEKLIQSMIDMKFHHHAKRFMKLLHLEDCFADQKNRIQEDQRADLRSFRALVKRRSEAASIRRGLFGAHNSPHESVVIMEKLWYSQSKIVENIPEDPRQELFNPSLKSQDSFYSLPDETSLARRQSSFYSIVDADDNGDEEIVLLGSNRNIALNPEDVFSGKQDNDQSLSWLNSSSSHDIPYAQYQGSVPLPSHTEYGNSDPWSQPMTNPQQSRLNLNQPMSMNPQQSRLNLNQPMSMNPQPSRLNLNQPMSMNPQQSRLNLNQPMSMNPQQSRLNLNQPMSMNPQQAYLSPFPPPPFQQDQFYEVQPNPWNYSSASNMLQEMNLDASSGYHYSEAVNLNEETSFTNERKSSGNSSLLPSQIRRKKKGPKPSTH